MCGIGGIVNFKSGPVNGASLLQMISLMKERGPDDDGFYMDGPVGLCHTRLSIIDLSSDGHQPFFCSENRFVIVFNGEIYNYLELKEELQSSFVFRTKTDTEVLLNAFKKWGPACLDKLNGMFAFAIYDSQTKEVFAARDRFGIKPFYYSLDQEKFVFASDFKPILSQIPNKVRVNNDMVYDFLVFDRTNHTENTFFSNIKKLQHGHYLSIYNGQVSIHRWYDLKSKINTPFQSPDDYKEALINSLKLQLRSDVAVGACLSGGLDSSSIVSLLLKNFHFEEIKTFSAIYNLGDRGDESTFINLYADEIKNMFFVKPKPEDLVGDIYDFVSTLGEPVPSSSVYAEYRVMKLAKGNAVVVLNGQGADEALGGYLYFYGYFFYELFRSLNLPLFIKELYFFWKNHRSFIGFQAFLYFSLSHELQVFLSQKNKGYLSKDFLSSFGNKNNDNEVSQFLNAKTLEQSFLNHFEYKFEHNLIWGDKNSMKHSIELRFPFLDHNLVERTIGVENKHIINKGVTKSILRESMKGILPEKIRLRQDKVGFETPESAWFSSTIFKEFSSDIFNSSSFQNRSFVDQKRFSDVISGLKSKKNNARELWKMLNLELWLQNNNL